jgi:thiol-disulfide isomerase/thioredoxin
MRAIGSFVFTLLFLSSCMQNASEKKPADTPILEEGKWKLSFITQKYEVPIRALIEDSTLKIINGEEIISFEMNIRGDSFYVPIPNYDSHLEGIIQSNSSFRGVFIKDYVEDYSIPFIAERNNENVFETRDSTQINLSHKYAVQLIDGEDISPGIGIFKQNGNIITASIATETGDYRYLEGVINKQQLFLSTFDGSRLYLFTADIKGDSLLNGKFISGKGGNYTWDAHSDPNVTLRDPEDLTFIKEGYDHFDFNLIDLNNKPTSLSDKRFQNKVKIIQIMGTWCSNCLDETKYFNKLYSLYKDKGLEIIAVAFENGNDTIAVLEKLKRYKLNNNIEYTILYGGKNGGENAEKVFPMLNKIMSFPTAIYLDPSNNVRKIYTGFYGPGTGDYFIEYTEKNEVFINSLLEGLNN